MPSLRRSFKKGSNNKHPDLKKQKQTNKHLFFFIYKSAKISTNVVLYLNNQFTLGIKTQGPLFTSLRADTPSRISAVAGVPGQGEAGIAIRGASPDVQVHVGTERVKPRVVLLAHDLVFHVGRMFRGRADGAATFIHVALWGPDGTKKSRHGRQTSGAGEVGLKCKRGRGKKKEQKG